MRKSLTFYLVLGIIANLLVNFSNIGLIKKTHPNNHGINTQSMLNSTAIWSVDNEYYLTPPENFINGDGWKRSPAVGNGSYFRRTPGYSLLYYFSMKILGKDNGILGMVIFQNLLYLLSIYCVFIIGIYLFKEHQLAQKIFSILYSVLPFFYSYNFFTLTESISLFLTIFSLYFSVIAYYSKKRKHLYYILASLLISYNTLTRPFAGMMVFIVPFLVFIDQDIFGIKKKLKIICMYMMFFVLPISIWTARNYAVSNELVILEKLSHPQSLDRSKPEFMAFWELVQCWGEDGMAFNTYFMPFYDSVLAGKDGKIQIQNIINKMNPKLWSSVSKKEFENTINTYKSILIIQKPFYQNLSAMPSNYLDLECQVTEQFNLYKRKYVTANPIDYYIKAPIKYYRDLVINSYSSHLFLLQTENINGSIILTLLKIFMLIIYVLMHVSTIACVFIYLYNIFLKQGKCSQQIIITFLSLLSLLFIASLIFIFRAIEQRYFHPYLIFILIAFVHCVTIVLKKLKIIRTAIVN